jgi:uncharacterized protein YbjT (DUF2867 family)
MIAITGATGTVGGQVLRRIPAGTALRVLARDPARVGSAPPGAEIAKVEYADEAALSDALSGVRSAFLVTTDVSGTDDDAFVRAALRAGVRHVVKLSAAAVEDPRANDAITRWQRAVELLLRRSGLEWTFLRPRAFTSNCLGWANSIRREGVVRALHGTSANAVVDPRDVADAAVRALTEQGHAGHAYTLTGPEPISAQEQAATLAELLGTPLRFEELTPDQARAALLRRYPEVVADALIESSARQRDGGKSLVTDAVGRLLGRPASTFAQWAKDHLDAFTPVAGS